MQALVLHIETGPHNHSAKVSEAVLSTNDEEWLVKVWMVFPKFLLLDFSVNEKKKSIRDISINPFEISSAANPDFIKNKYKILGAQKGPY